MCLVSFTAFCEVGKLPNAQSLLSLLDLQTSPQPLPCQFVKGNNPVRANYHVELTGDVYKWWIIMNHWITLGLLPSPQRCQPVLTQGKGVCWDLEMEQWLYTQYFRQILTQIDISLNTLLRKTIKLPNHSHHTPVLLPQVILVLWPSAPHSCSFMGKGIRRVKVNKVLYIL